MGVSWLDGAPVIGAFSAGAYEDALRALAHPAVAGTIALAMAGVIVGLLLARRCTAPEPSEQGSDDVTIVGCDRLQPGARVTIEAFGLDAVRSFPANLVAVERCHLRFTVPASALPMPRGVPVTIISVDHSALLRGHSFLVDHGVRGGAVTVCLRRPAWLERVQRRQYFRVPLEVPTMVSPVPARAAHPAPYRGLITELSASGLRVASPAPFCAGQVLRLRVPVPALGEPAVDSRVLRCTVSEHRGYPFSAACEFLYLSEETREGIVQFCFDAQRTARRRGPGSARH